MTYLKKIEFVSVYENIKEIMLRSKQEVLQSINTTLVKTYWKIDLTIVKDEQNHAERAEYGQGLIKELSKKTY